MSDYERKFGKYAVRDLSLKLIILYLIGYVIYYIRPDILYYMTLNPYAIVHGQVWRLISWLLIPPSASNLFFIAIMMFFYYSIGTSLERVWGTWRYNVFIFTGILLTIVSAFLWMGFTYLTGSGGALIVLIGINLMGLKKIKTANYLPAVLFSALFVLCEHRSLHIVFFAQLDSRNTGRSFFHLRDLFNQELEQISVRSHQNGILLVSDDSGEYEGVSLAELCRVHCLHARFKLSAAHCFDKPLLGYK